MLCLANHKYILSMDMTLNLYSNCSMPYRELPYLIAGPPYTYYRLYMDLKGVHRVDECQLRT